MKLRVVCLLVLVFFASIVSASAQTSVRVVRDQSTIWRQGFLTPATVVRTGTILEVVGRSGMWYEVRLPQPTGTRETGFIAINQVEVVAGGDRQAPAAGQPVATPPQAQQPGPVPREPPLPGTTGFRVFGQIGYGWVSAKDSFKALFGSNGSVWFGGGGEYAFPGGLFVQGSVDVFRQSGTRVFVLNDQVFDLGIPDRITMIPIAGTVGYRFGRGRIRPYVGGGAGLQLYKEKFDFAQAGENIDETFTSYHGLGGVEFRHSPRLGTAVEVQYSHVSNDLTGLADVFDEHDLGGLQIRGKVLFGGW